MHNMYRKLKFTDPKHLKHKKGQGAASYFLAR